MDKSQLNKTFKSHLDRSLFISSYEKFGKDNYNDFYIDFIDTSITVNNSRVQEDALELSIALHVYKSEYLEIVSQIIKSRRSAWIKLLCLDWLFNFYLETPPSVFIELNYAVLKTANLEVIRIQGLINLILREQALDNFKSELTIIFSNTCDSAVYHRMIIASDNIAFCNFVPQLKSIMLSALLINDKLNDIQITSLKLQIDQIGL